MNYLVQDINGDLARGTNEGEVLNNVRDPILEIEFASDSPRANIVGQKVAFTVEQARHFIWVQIVNLLNANAHCAQQNRVTVDQAARIGYWRLIAASQGLISPDFAPGANHVQYNDAVRQHAIDRNAVVAFINANQPIFNGFDLRVTLSEGFCEGVKDSFVDMVCLIAYVFRARGHHYVDSAGDPYGALYDRIWQKCRRDVNQVGVPFRFVALHALHAIYPNVLDQTWRHYVDTQGCNGALIKRFDTAPAGSAAAFIVEIGYRDIRMVAPGIETALGDAVPYMRTVVGHLKADRWVGSVNARYYGVERYHYDESRFSAIAATLQSALSALAERNPMLGSNALRRVAANAPIIGAVLGNAMSRLPDREETIAPLLMVAPPAQ
jgi:hypothetical protein